MEAQPSNAEARWLLSKTLLGLGELDQALASAEQSITLDADNAAYHAQLGIVLGRMAEKAPLFKQLGLARRTRKELESSVALDPRNLDGLFALALYYFSAPSFLGGDKTKAADLADRIGDIDPQRGYQVRAALAQQQNDAAAELDFRLSAVAADPENFEAQSDLAQYYLDHSPHNWPALEETGCKLLEIDPARLDGWRVLATVHAASHCWTELDQLLEGGERLNPTDLSPYYAAATSMVSENERLPAARGYLEKYLSQPPDGSEPSHAMARWQLATLLEKEQHPDEAMAQLDQALQEDPGLEPARKDLQRLKGK